MFARTPPPGHAIRTDRSTRLVDEGRLVISGSPRAHVPCPPHKQERSSAGSATHPSTGAAGRGLAADLIAAGMAHPHPPTPYPTVPPSFTTVEVDGAVSRAAALTAADTDVLALLSPGAHPEPGLLESALAHFADPSVAAVVPRVLPDRTGPLGYVQAAVAAVAADLLGLDRGADPGPVRPWGQTRADQAPAGPTGEFTTTDPLCSVPVLLVRRRALGPVLRPGAENEGARFTPGAAPLAPEADTTQSTGQEGDPCPGPQDVTTVPILSRTVSTPTVHYDPKLQESADIDLLWSLVEAGWSVGHEPRSRVRVAVPIDPAGYLRAHTGW